ncbi:MAG: hypothetical protein B6U72_05240 [Candidatus Altiarchaeales archaeon ex4484_2]|nr:MAG: hypothetical protein B6U72_05240 [Candidatus Altiarchaeales archaeon ex4484_2]
MFADRTTQEKLKEVITAAAGERDKTLKELEQTKKIIDAIFETTPDYIFTKDQDKKYTLVNPAMETLLQKPASEIKGKTDEHILPKKLAEKTRETDHNTLSGKISREEYTETISDIQTTLEIVKMPLRDRKGKIKAIFGTARDLTEHKKTKHALQQLLKSTDNIAFILDKKQRYTGVFGQLSEIFNLTEEQFIGKKMQDVLGDEAIIHEIYSERALNGEETVYEWSTPESRDYLMHLSPLRNPQGEITGAVCVGQDITEHKKAAKKLRNSENRFHELAELLPEMVFEADEDGKITYTNHRFMEYNRGKLDEGLSILQIITPRERKRAWKDMKRALRGEQLRGCEYTLQRRDGSTFPASLHITPIIQGNKPVGLRGLVTDSTEIKKAQETREKYTQMLQRSPEIIILLDKRGNLLDINERIHGMLGYRREEIIGKNICDVPFIPNTRIMDNLSETIPYETELISKTGEKKTGLIHTTQLKNKQRDVTGEFIIISDVTERKKAEYEIRQQTEDISLINSLNITANQGGRTTKILHILAEETRKMFSCFGAMIYLLSNDKKKLILSREHIHKDIDRELMKVVGRNAGTKTRREVMIPLKKGGFYDRIMMDGKPELINDSGKIQLFLGELMGNRMPENHILTIYKTLGIKSMIMVPLYSSGGECIGLMEVSRRKPFNKSDLRRLSFIAENLTTILNRKLAEESLKASRASLHNIVEKSADGVLVIDKDRVVRYLNPAVESFFDKDAAEFIGKPLELPFKPGESVEVDIMRDKDDQGVGEVRVVETRWEGEPAYLAMIRDITERKKMEETIRRQVDELMRLDQAKTEFISIAGHELRTPAQSMILATDILLGEPNLTLSEKKYLKIIQKECLRLKKLINDLLELSSLQLGKTELSIKELDVGSILADAIEDVSLKAKEKKISLRVNKRRNLNRIKGDRDALNRVLINLLGNAIKFTPEGGEVRVTASNGASGVVVCIEDNGLGVPPELKEKLFDRFFQVNPMIEKKEGFGLGLSICKEIIDAHNGNIWCESEEGGGSKFCFTIPSGGEMNG